MEKIRYWTTKDNILRNARMLKKLSYFRGFHRIEQDRNSRQGVYIVINVWA